MTPYRTGDIVLVPFDFTDRSGNKWRPAVIVSSDGYNQTTPDVLIASVTGNLRAIPRPGDRRIASWQAAGLLRASLAQTKRATLEATIIGRRLGALEESDMAAPENGLREALSLP